MTEPTPPAFNESDELRALQRDARALIKQLEPFAKLKPGDAKALAELERATAALPPAAGVAAAVEELRARAEGTLKAGRASRTEGFRRVEADFIRDRREAGETTREAGNSSWRIGRLELEVDRARAQARALYNRQVVCPWLPVAEIEDMKRLLATASKHLDDAALPDDALMAVLTDAYDHLRSRARRTDASGVRIPLPDFYREVRVALARHELTTGKADRKLARAEFPMWAFLYNLDRYRRLANALPAEQRLNFETGSQHDHQKGIAMIVNGLDAKDDYKSYCYVFNASAVK